MRELLKRALLAQHPAMKPLVAERCVRNYVEAVMRQIATQLALASHDDWSAGELTFRADAVRDQCGQVVVGSQRVRAWTLMQSHPSTSLVLQVYVGNSISGRASRIVFNPTYKKEIMDALRALSIELDPKHLDELDTKANVELTVDPDSLASFLKQTRRTLQQHTFGEAYERKLIRTATIGNTLQSRIRARQDGSYFVREYWERIDSGRMYGHGLSLQRIPKEVRHAVLGECHKYDFKASSYALLASLAVQIDPTLQVAAIKDYIRNRSSIRARVAKAVGISEEWAKAVFTAIGFGAELRDNPHNAIRAKLGHDKYNLLVGNAEFAMIAKQLKAVSKTIDKAFPNTGFQFFGSDYSPLDPHTGARRTKNQKLAWIYQRMESEALRMFVDLADEQPLLVAHDCAYFKHKLPASKTEDMALVLSRQFELLRFEHEKVIPIHAVEDTGLRDALILADIAAHTDRIQAEERQAAMYLSPSLSDLGELRRLVPTPWGLVDAGVLQLAAG